MKEEVKYMYSKILLMIDDSKFSERAIHKVIEFQKTFNCKIVMATSIKHHKLPLFAVYTVPSSYGSFYVSEEELLEESRQEGEEFLIKMLDFFIRENIHVETRLIEDEHPEDYIEQTVKDENFDLVVLGINSFHSKLKHKSIGSVSHKIVKKTPCDILIIGKNNLKGGC